MPIHLGSHNLVACWLLGFLGQFAVDAAAQDQPFPLVAAQECRPRNGLPNFFAKVRLPRADVRVAFLGGSITEQPGFRPRTLAYFKQSYPDARFSEINAAIGGTGSELGVYRLRHDVLDFKPDLLFIEFATNDGGTPPLRIQRCMEGIVRQTWKALPKCDICFVYTIVESAAGPMLDGKFQPAASAMEAVADEYGIPSIHLAMEVARLAKQGKLIWAAPLPKTDAEQASLGDKLVFAADGVHPYPETGHELYLKAIVRSWKPIADVSKPARPHTVKSPMLADNYEHAMLVPITEATLSPGFLPLDPGTDEVARIFAAKLPSLRRGTQPGDSVTFRFRGTCAAILDVIGPDTSQVKVTLDHQPPTVVPRFDFFCSYGYRRAVVPIGIDLTDTIHTVKVEIDREQPDRTKIMGDRAKKLERPERFTGTNFYPGAILVVGEVVR
jgi:lysophospholipase L1-like esterase